MKRAALPLILAAVLLGTGACSEPTSKYIPAITLKADTPEEGDTETMGASLSLQALFTAINTESVKTEEELESMDYANLKEAYPKTIDSIDESSVGQDSVERLIREYSIYLAEVPEGGTVVIDPSSAKEEQSGEIQISGSDVYLSYPEGEATITHKGLSVDTAETLDDVFTMKQVDGKWKIAGVSF